MKSSNRESNVRHMMQSIRSPVQRQRSQMSIRQEIYPHGPHSEPFTASFVPSSINLLTPYQYIIITAQLQTQMKQAYGAQN
ncbi:hypothetical protein B566_EDAN008182 [Ephemera danica]|nr:hypothetical protein B566_EDAN008182 [Ephemera danica]